MCRSEEAELEQLMQKRSLLPLGVLLHGDPCVVNTHTVFGSSCNYRPERQCLLPLFVTLLIIIYFQLILDWFVYTE